MDRFERQTTESDNDYKARLGPLALISSVKGESIPTEVAEILENDLPSLEERVTAAGVVLGQGEEAIVDYLLGR